VAAHGRTIGLLQRLACTHRLFAPGLVVVNRLPAVGVAPNAQIAADRGDTNGRDGPLRKDQRFIASKKSELVLVSCSLLSRKLRFA
jgi:hypothetical protein